jgi:predicted ATP-grasp superfamily ATP-dependent carboligase
MTSLPPVLVLGSGVTGLGVIRTFGADGIRAYTADVSDPLMRRSRWFHRLPPPHDVVPDEEHFEEWLHRLPFERAVLMACSDHWLARVAALDATTRARFPASVPAPATIQRFVDKASFAALLRETSTPHPWSGALDTAADLDAVPDAVFDSAMLKPRDSQRFNERFGVKALHVTSRADAREQFSRVTRAGFPVILQEYVPGPATQHYFVEGFIDRHGVPRAVFARQRLRMYPFDFGNSTSMISVAAEAVPGATASILGLLRHAGYRGIFSAEFKLDPRDSVFKILEVNVRPWWYIDFAARCGVDVCRLAYRDALDEPVETIGRYRVGQTLVYPHPDFFACADLWRHRQLSLWRWAREWLGAMQPVYRASDPWPGVRAFAGTITGFLGRRLRRLGHVAAGTH